jgi:hypothetical protein
MRLLPSGFEELERYVTDWDVPSVSERYLRRKSSTQQQLEEFYHAVLPRIDDILAHLDHFDIYALPEPERKLYRVLCGLCESSAAVELIGAPFLAPPDGHDVEYKKGLEVL